MQHIADHRQHRVRLLLNQRARQVVPLGHPRAVIEQFCCRQERRKVDGHRHAAKSDQPLLCGVIQRLALCAAEKLQRVRHAKAKTGCRYAKCLRSVPGRVSTAVVIVRVFRRRQRQQLAGLSCRAGEERYAVQRATGGHHTRCRDQPFGRLQPDQIIERGRNAPAPGGIGAQGKARQPQRHSQRRARA